MNKIIIIVFLLISSCVLLKDKRKCVDYDERRIVKNNVKIDNIVIKKSTFDIIINERKNLSSKCIINLNKRKGIVISLIPYVNFEAFRIFLDGNNLKIVDRESKKIYEKNIFENNGISRVELNKIYCSILLNNYYRKYKYVANITDNNEKYSEWIKNITDEERAYIYIDRRYYKIKEIYYAGKNMSLLINYKTYSGSDIKICDQINIELKKGDTKLNIKLKIDDYEEKKEGDYIYLIPKSYNKIDNINLDEFLEKL